MRSGLSVSERLCVRARRKMLTTQKNRLFDFGALRAAGMLGQNRTSCDEARLYVRRDLSNPRYTEAARVDMTLQRCYLCSLHTVLFRNRFLSDSFAR